MAVFERLETTNFRLLEHFAISFDEHVTVLVGPNNAGKSNVIDALLLIRDALRAGNFDGPLKNRHGIDRVVSRHDRARELLIRVFAAADTWYELAFEPGGDFREQAVIAGADQGVRRQGFANQPVLFGNWPEIGDRFRALTHVDPFRQVSVEVGVGPVTMVQASGYDLAQVLHFHYNNDRERFDSFEDVVRRVLPEVDIIETPITTGSQTTVSVRLVDGEERFDLWQLSSGVKDVLVLLSAIHFSAPQTLLLIEEPENHLHPAAQKALAAVIRDAATNERKQVIVTTHSELVMEQFEPHQVFFIDRVNGVSQATRLDEAPVFTVWERLGIERTRLLEALGRARQIILVMEGRDDVKVLEPVLEHYELADTVVAVRTGGGGYESIVDNARALQDALTGVRLSSRVFVLLDNDGDRDAKVAYLQGRGFDGTASHVWALKEIESYLLIASALAAISGRPVVDVDAVIAASDGAGKAKLEAVTRELGIADVGLGTIITNALRAGAGGIPAEFEDLVGKLRALLGLA